MLNGVINIYKEPGYTSHDVVARLRGITKQKRIGHTGTLDPDAEGVLCVCLGAATRICDMLTDATKEYLAKMRLGVSTDTQDMSGHIISERKVEVSDEAIYGCVMSFIGDIQQIPPMYSAIKHNGRKLYELAREGVEVERKPRRVKIYDIEIGDISIPYVTMRVTCSKGTYIRTLCNDIGEALGCGGAMEHLIRTRVGDFDITGASKLDYVEALMKEGRIGEILTPLTEVFGDLKSLKVNSSGSKKASNGNILEKGDISLHNIESADLEEVIITDDKGFFYGIYRFDAAGYIFRPVKMFLC